MANENLESKRWLLAIAGVVIMLILGTVYACGPRLGSEGCIESFHADYRCHRRFCGIRRYFGG